jgi:cation transport ATPase
VELLCFPCLDREEVLQKNEISFYIYVFWCFAKGILDICNILISFADILFDGFRAFKQGSPNMNSLVGFGSIAAFTISTVSELS